MKFIKEIKMTGFILLYFPSFIYITAIRQTIMLSKQLYTLRNKHRSIAVI